MDTKTILLVEDEKRLSDLLCDYLHQSSYETACLYDGTYVVQWVKGNKPDLLLLDLMLPGKDGLEICKEIRHFSDVPIIIITARIEEIDKLLGLELGADDYICKPFSPREVMARVKAVLRRSSGRMQNIRVLDLDTERFVATLQGQELDLTAVEFQLLRILFEKEGRILTRDQLMDRIYTDRRIVCDRTIDSHIKKITEKNLSGGAGP
jgi:two-component system response regulator BaeR